MRKIYIGADCRCHTADDGTMVAVETDIFDGKCDAFVEGYRYIPLGAAWVRDDGEIFEGEMMAPWKDFEELDTLQREHEAALLKEYAQALQILEVVL